MHQPLMEIRLFLLLLRIQRHAGTQLETGACQSTFLGSVRRILS